MDSPDKVLFGALAVVLVAVVSVVYFAVTKSTTMTKAAYASQDQCYSDRRMVDKQTCLSLCISKTALMNQSGGRGIRACHQRHLDYLGVSYD